MNADIQRAASGMQVAAAFQPPGPEARADYYDYQQRTQRMGPQTAMGLAGASADHRLAVPCAGRATRPGYPAGVQRRRLPDNGDGEQDERRRPPLAAVDHRR